MTPSVCFTGAGEVNGIKITRDAWETAARVADHYVTNANTCDILVESRSDTVKAEKARQRGASIMSYDEYAGQLLMDGVKKLGNYDLYDLVHNSGRFQREVERQDAADRVAAKRAARMKELEELESNPLFGMF